MISHERSMIGKTLLSPARRWWVGIGASVALGAFLVARAHPTRMGTAFLRADWRWVAVAAALMIVSLVLRSAALKIIVDALGTCRARLTDAFSATSIGLLANSVVPIRVGTVLSPYVLYVLLRRRGAAVPFATTLGDSLTERLFAIATFVALAFVFVSTLPAPAWTLPVLAACAAFAATFLVGGAYLEHRRQREARAGLQAGDGPPADGRGRRHYLVEIVDSQRIMGKPRSALLVAGVQALAWLVQLAAAYAALRAFHLGGAGLRGAALVLVLTNLIGLIPITPANLGTFQAAAAAALAVYGVAAGPAVAYAFGLQGLQLVVALIAGLVSLSVQDLTLAELRGRSHQAAALLYRAEPAAPPGAEEIV